MLREPIEHTGLHQPGHDHEESAVNHHRLAAKAGHAFGLGHYAEGYQYRQSRQKHYQRRYACTHQYNDDTDDRGYGNPSLQAKS